MVQIRNVPAGFHRRLKARAAMEGMSMSDYILREVGKALDRPTRQEVLDRLRNATGPPDFPTRRRRHSRRTRRPMIVLDASALVELLLGKPTGTAGPARIADPSLGVHVPHLVDVEVVQALRRYAREGEIDEDAALDALDDLHGLDLQRHPHEPFLDRVWMLRRNLTAYDAVYVALAEVLDCRVLTCDAALARAPGMRARVDVVR